MLMLKGQIQGFNSSWAILWYASAFLKEKLTLYPGKSLILNIGFDLSGTHSGKTNIFSGKIYDQPVKVGGIEIKESEAGLNAIRNYFNSYRLRISTASSCLGYYHKALKKKFFK